MAKFCTQCGRPLQEGEVCNCQQKMVPPSSAPRMESAGTESAEKKESAPNMSGQSQPGPSGMNRQGQPGPNSMNPQYRQAGPNGMSQQGPNGVNQQGQPRANGMNQQGQPGMSGANPQYRQAGPNGTNPQYRQAGPNGANQQYRQQGSNGANPQYRQAGSNGANQQYRQQGPGMNQQYRQPQGAPVNVNEIGNKAKNIFGDMLESIKKPVAYARVLTRRAYSKVGMEMIIFKGIVALIVTLLCTFSLSMMVKSVIREAMGGWSGLLDSSGYSYDVSLPWFQIILLVIVLTFGADFLEALWMKLLTRTNKSYMVMTVNVGVRCAFDTLAIVICGLFAILACLVKSPFMLFPAAIVLIVYGVSMPFIQFACYNAVLNDDPDSKVRRYILVKVLQGISVSIIFSVFGFMVTESIVNAFSRVF